MGRRAVTTMAADIASRGRRAWPWLAKGTWTVLDQGLFAGSNFVLNVVLARWLAPADYGAFTVAYTVFLLFATLHAGWLAEPMLVFGPGRYRERLPDYLRILLRGQAGFAAGLGLVLAGAGLVVRAAGVPALGDVLLVLGGAQYCILLLWLVRQACYVQTRPRWAASGGALYALAMLGGTTAAYAAGWLSATLALVLMSASSLAAAVWLLRRLGTSPFGRVDAGLGRDVRRHHLRYGRWAAATGVLEWVPGYLAFVLLPLWAGLEASGTLKALLNFIMPAAHAYGALCTLLVPVFVRAREGGGFERLFGRVLAGVCAATGAYWLLLGLYGAPLLDLLYGGAYTAHARLLWLVGSIPFMAGVASLLRTALRALEQPDHVFWAYLGSALLAATAGLWLIYNLGLAGALYAFLVQMTAEIGVMLFFLFRRPRTVAAPTPQPAEAW